MAAGVPLLVGALLTSCTPEQPAMARHPDPTVRLCQHIQLENRRIVVDTNRAELIWSDGAILEVGTQFPRPLNMLVAAPTHCLDIWGTLAELNAQRHSAYQPAFARPDNSVGPYVQIIASHQQRVNTLVKAIYFEYLEQRHPRATLWIKGKEDPVLFVVTGEVRAVIMPMKTR
jgi:hypothetical protein